MRVRILFDQGLDAPVGQSVQLLLKIAAGQVDALSGCFLNAGDDIDRLLLDAREIQQRGLQKLRLNV